MIELLDDLLVVEGIGLGDHLISYRSFIVFRHCAQLAGGWQWTVQNWRRFAVVKRM